MTTLDEFHSSARHFDLVTAECNIASWNRGFALPGPEEWLDAENIALRVLLDSATFDPRNLFAADGVEDTMVNVLARALGNCHRSTATYPTEFLASLAALTFAGAGNFPSASVFAAQARESNDAGPAEQWMMRFLANPRWGLSDSSPPLLFRQYAILEDAALHSGFEEDFTRASKVFWSACERAADELEPSDRYLLLLWTHVHQRLKELSAARILKKIAFPHQGYAPALLETTPLLYPPQAQILQLQDKPQEYLLTQPGENLLISLPTSTGKSLIGEMALISSLRWNPRQRWLAVYLAPYRALADQLHDRMGKRLRQIDVDCIKRRGDYLSDMTAIKERRPAVVVATPESFDDLLRRQPNLYSCLSACVFDEFHLVEQHQRGLRYEGLLGRFLHGAAGDGWPKIIALSAVVTDVTEVKRWLKLKDSNFVHSAWKPTGRRIAVTSPTGRVDYFTLGEDIPGRNKTGPAWQGHIRSLYQVERAPVVKHPGDPEYGRYLQDRKRTEQEVRDNIVSVALDQYCH